MPKRKRDAIADNVAADVDDSKPAGARQQRVAFKIDHGQKLLNRAFKTAKGFERQKLGRRRKTAASNTDAKEVARIDSETAVLKVGTTKIPIGK